MKAISFVHCNHPAISFIICEDGIARCSYCYDKYRMHFSDGTPVAIYEEMAEQYANDKN